MRERETDRETHGGGGGFFFFFLLLLLPASDPPPPRRPTACSHAAYSSAALFVRGGPTLPSFAETRLDRLTLPSNPLRLTFAAAAADAADVFGDQVPGAISVERVALRNSVRQSSSPARPRESDGRLLQPHSNRSEGGQNTTRNCSCCVCLRGAFCRWCWGR